MAVNSGTQALSTTAIALPNRPCRSAQITNNDASISMLLGNASSQSFTLIAGQTVTIAEVGNLNQIYAKSASGTPTLSYLTT